MFNKRKTALSAMVVSTVLVASFFAIIFVQQALAQGNNMTSSGGAMTNKTGSNMTNMTKASSTGGGNTSGGPNMTGIGAATGGAVKSPSAGGK